jgi:hypothetical protein
MKGSTAVQQKLIVNKKQKIALLRFPVGSLLSRNRAVMACVWSGWEPFLTIINSENN